MTFFILPIEMKLYVFQNLKPKDWVVASSVCRSWNKVVKRDELWQSVFHQKYPFFEKQPNYFEAMKCRWHSEKSVLEQMSVGKKPDRCEDFTDALNEWMQANGSRECNFARRKLSFDDRYLILSKTQYLSSNQSEHHFLIYCRETQIIHLIPCPTVNPDESFFTKDYFYFQGIAGVFRVHLPTRQVEELFGLGSKFCVSPDNQKAVIVDGNKVYLEDRRSHQKTVIQEGPSDKISITFSYDSTLICIHSCGTSQFFDASDGTAMPYMDSFSKCAFFSSDSSKMGQLSLDGETLEVYRFFDGKRNIELLGRVTFADEQDFKRVIRSAEFFLGGKILLLTELESKNREDDFDDFCPKIKSFLWDPSQPELAPAPFNKAFSDGEGFEIVSTNKCIVGSKQSMTVLYEYIPDLTKLFLQTNPSKKQ